MDPFGMAVSAFKFGIETVQMMQKNGMLGGSTDWVNYIPDIDLLYENFVKFKGILQNRDEYDRVNAMSPEDKKAFVYSHVLLEGMEEKNRRMREKMGLGEPIE